MKILLTVRYSEVLHVRTLYFDLPSTDKCLAPYYGGCDPTRECLNSRNGVSCGDCLPGYVDIPGESGESFCAGGKTI